MPALSWIVLTTLAGVVVSLPPSEDRSAWAAAAEQVGVTLGDGDADVRVRAEGGRWAVTVQPSDGPARGFTAAPPRTEAEREDLLATALSLLNPMPTPALPPVALPPPAPSPPARPTVAAPRPAPMGPFGGPVVLEPPVPPIAAASPATRIPRVPPLHAPPWRPSASLAAAASLRPGASTGFAPALQVGLQRSRLRLEVGAWRQGAVSLQDLSADRGVLGWGAGAGVGRVGPGWTASGVLGVEARQWTEGEAVVARTRTPVARGAVGWSFAVAGPVQLGPRAWVAVDLGRTQVFVDDVLVTALTPLSAGLGLDLTLAPPEKVIVSAR
ncbi:MAG: hypothetical protein H6739_29655 [Alphaproteobacteria bacterium]|nr:hypothetical protein [Alphaproteobacteria bacterium]